MNNRALLGLFVVLLIIFGGLYFFRDRVNLLSLRPFTFPQRPTPTEAREQVASDSATPTAGDTSDDALSSDTTDIAGTSDTADSFDTNDNSDSNTDGTSSNADGTVTGDATDETKGGLQQIPATGTNSDTQLISCTPEMYEQSCGSTLHEPVCGYEKIVGTDGTEGIRSLDYISACHYCKLYAPDGKLALGSETIHALGYEAGACTQ